uniref:PAR1 protein n=1 Tax=Salix viminalis TaxID=40686 RepID=A0A6N2KC46_SALVM
MAPSLNILSVMAIALVICVQGTLGEIACEHLDQDTCAYAISSAGKRCVLEKRVKRTGEEAYTCRTSEIEADRLRNWIETDECIKACGLDRKSLGISTDSLLESSFAQQLCSPQCYDSCPNVVDLYFNLAAAEGVFLPKLCEAQEGSARRGLIMADIKSSGFVAPGQLHPVKYTVAPAPIKPVKYTVAPAPVEPLKYTVVPAMSPY